MYWTSGTVFFAIDAVFMFQLQSMTNMPGVFTCTSHCATPISMIPFPEKPKFSTSRSMLRAIEFVKAIPGLRVGGKYL
jgi:hypothetical protein